MEDRPPRRGIDPTTRAAQVCAALNGAGARYLVIGGVACILHGYLRATRDVDILIEPTVENARRVLQGLEGVGYGFAKEWLPEEIAQKPITIIGDDPAVDIFTVAWSVKYKDAVVRSQAIVAEGVTIPFVGLDDLIATKRTGRPRDTIDLGVLEEIRDFRVEGG
jgi:hypothetical protein